MLQATHPGLPPDVLEGGRYMSTCATSSGAGFPAPETSEVEHPSLVPPYGPGGPGCDNSVAGTTSSLPFVLALSTSPVQPFAMALGSTMGALFIGMVFDAVLYGLMTLQTYRYFHLEYDDRWRLRSLVILLWILDTFQLALICHVLYYFLILHYGETDILQYTVWSLNIEISISVIITFLVRSFFSARVWHLSGKNKILAIIIMIFSFAQLGLGIAMSILCFFIKRFDRLPDFEVPLSVQLACAVAADMMVSGPLVYYLNKSRTGLQRTNSLINLLIVWSVNTAIITGVVELLQLITWVTMPNNLVFIVFHLTLGKLYTNSMLAMLNGRKKLRENLEGQMINTGTIIIAPQDETRNTGDIMLRSETSFPGSSDTKPILSHVDTTSFGSLSQRRVVDPALLAALESPTTAVERETKSPASALWKPSDFEWQIPDRGETMSLPLTLNQQSVETIDPEINSSVNSAERYAGVWGDEAKVA